MNEKKGENGGEEGNYLVFRFSWRGKVYGSNFFGSFNKRTHMGPFSHVALGVHCAFPIGLSIASHRFHPPVAVFCSLQLNRGCN